MATPDHTALARFRARKVPISSYFTFVFHERHRASQGIC